MNGPRTNQFVAPTSFITSISRRRAKIESRIVFAISSVEAIRSSDHADQEDDRDHPADLQHALRGLAAVVDLVHARRRRSSAGRGSARCTRPSSA